MRRFVNELSARLSPKPLRSFWVGAQALTVADRKIELDYVFDRLGDLQLIQAYHLLVPERRKLIERGQGDDDSGDLRKGLFGQTEERSNDRQPDGGVEGVRSLLRARSSI
jgi:hypothetical protein